jgi:hypothetical protein
MLPFFNHFPGSYRGSNAFFYEREIFEPRFEYKFTRENHSNLLFPRALLAAGFWHLPGTKNPGTSWKRQGRARQLQAAIAHSSDMSRWSIHSLFT